MAGGAHTYAHKLRHVVLMPFCICLQRMRQFETDQERLDFLRKAKRRFAHLDHTDKETVRQAERALGMHPDS